MKRDWQIGANDIVAEGSDLNYAIEDAVVGWDDARGVAAFYLKDRCVNQVVAAGDATLVFPERPEGGARDFYVRLRIPGQNVPSLYFVEPDLTPVKFAAGNWEDLQPGLNLVMFSDISDPGEDSSSPGSSGSGWGSSSSGPSSSPGSSGSGWGSSSSGYSSSSSYSSSSGSSSPDGAEW